MTERPRSPHFEAYIESLRVRSFARDTIQGHTHAVLSFFLATGIAELREKPAASTSAPTTPRCPLRAG